MRRSFLPALAFESVVLNDLLLTGDWKVDLQWFWATKFHINILESHAYLAFLRYHVRNGDDIRFTALLDSKVAKCSHAKGRSSKQKFDAFPQEGSSLADLWRAIPIFWVRTHAFEHRLPTRDAKFRKSCELSCIKDLDPFVRQRLHSLQFSRPTAGWIRLCLLLGCLPVSEGFPTCAGLWDCTWFPSLCGFCSFYSFLGSSLFITSRICSLLLVILFGLVLIGHCVLRMLPTNSAEPDAPKNPENVSPKLLGEGSPSSVAIAS